MLLLWLLIPKRCEQRLGLLQRSSIDRHCFVIRCREQSRGTSHCISGLTSRRDTVLPHAGTVAAAAGDAGKAAAAATSTGTAAAADYNCVTPTANGTGTADAAAANITAAATLYR